MGFDNYCNNFFVDKDLDNIDFDKVVDNIGSDNIEAGRQIG